MVTVMREGHALHGCAGAPLVCWAATGLLLLQAASQPFSWYSLTGVHKMVGALQRKVPHSTGGRSARLACGWLAPGVTVGLWPA